MNRQTAEHLNHLLELSQPMKIEDGLIQHPAATKEFGERLGAIWNSHIPIAQAMAIRSAARDKAKSEYICHDVRQHCGGNGKVIDVCRSTYGFSETVKKLAMPEIKAAIEADDARRLAEYEAYRMACEQGVALPPKSN